jgi:hypothetical protein
MIQFIAITFSLIIICCAVFVQFKLVKFVAEIQRNIRADKK